MLTVVIVLGSLHGCLLYVPCVCAMRVCRVEQCCQCREGSSIIADRGAGVSRCETASAEPLLEVLAAAHVAWCQRSGIALLARRSGVYGARTQAR